MIHVIWIVATFPVAWTLAFATVTQGDFRLYRQYVDLTWRGDGLDLVWGVMVLAFILSGFLWLIFFVARIVLLANRKHQD